MILARMLYWLAHRAIIRPVGPAPQINRSTCESIIRIATIVLSRGARYASTDGTNVFNEHLDTGIDSFVQATAIGVS
jgi:hypothetical protein